METKELTFSAELSAKHQSQEQIKAKKKLNKIINGQSLKMPIKHVSIFKDMATNKRNYPDKSVTDLIRDAYRKVGVQEEQIDATMKLPVIDRYNSEQTNERARTLPNYSTFFRWGNLIEQAYQSTDIHVKAQVTTDYASLRLWLKDSKGKDISYMDLPLAELTEIINRFQNN